MKKQTFNEIYKKVNHNPYTQVTNILKKATIKSNAKNLLKNYGNIILIIICIMLLIFLYTFRNNLITILYATILLFALFAITILYNTYKLSLEEEALKLKINFQTNIIPYNKLSGIYVERNKKRLFFFPIYYYNLIITYISDQKDRLNMYTLPLIMVNKKELTNFFGSFEYETYKEQEEDTKKEEENKKNMYKAIGISIGILLIIIFIIAIILYIFQKTN